MNTRVLYIFVDEGGDLVFSNSGTKFFTLTAMTSLRPFLFQEPVLNLKYNLWEQGLEFEYLHAANDTYKTRSELFKIISKNLNQFIIDSIVVEKRKTNPKLYDKKFFYIKVFERLFNYVLSRKIDNVSKVFIITDSIPIERKKKEIKKL